MTTPRSSGRINTKPALMKDITTASMAVIRVGITRFFAGFLRDARKTMITSNATTTNHKIATNPLNGPMKFIFTSWQTKC